MARYCPGFNTEPMFEVAELIKERCFKNDGSLFSDKAIWTHSHTKELMALFLERLDTGSGKYLEKMKKQMEGVQPELVQLMAELNYVLQFPQSNIGADKKNDTVKTIWGWSGSDLDTGTKPFQAGVLEGAFHPGQAYNTLRWKELLYLMRIVLAFKALPQAGRNALLENAWEFSSWLEEVDQDGSRQFQHVLKFLFFPDTFERIVTIKHKRAFAEKYLAIPESDVVNLSETELDEKLHQARKKYEDADPGALFDFYENSDSLRGASVEEPKSDYEVAVQKRFSSIHPLNVILYGPPGTGKTHHTMYKAVSIIDGPSAKDLDRPAIKSRYDALVEDDRVVFVTFHQSFSYEDFVEGLKAETESGRINYAVKPGVFKDLCRRAENDSKNGYVLIIDEINRGNAASIFGELITLIEPSKRNDADDSVRVMLPYSKDAFSVPSNLYLIGTMNTADRSLVHLDTALRRRFAFEEMQPDPNLLSNLPLIDGVNVARLLEVINQRIAVVYDRDHTIGHSYFLPLYDLKEPNITDLASIFDNQILPLLEEYFFEDWQRIRQVLADNRKPEGVPAIYVREMSDGEFYKLMGDDWQGETSSGWRRDRGALENPDTYKAIYQ